MKLDGKTLQESIRQIIDEYKFDPQQVLEIVKMGVKSAFRKDYLSGDKKYNIYVSIGKDGQIKIFKELEVVEEVEDTNKQIDLEQAADYKENAQIGDIIYIDITPENLEFSRISVQAAAQTIKQNMKKIERERFFEKFKDKEGEILKAKVLRLINENVVLDVEGTTVILSQDGQIPNRIYNEGEEILVLLRQISKGSGGVVLDITQSSNDFIETILRKSVPELDEGVVEILKITRFPGKKTKVLVDSDDDRVDPVGVFIGQNGERISNILSLLEGEKIEFIQKYDDPIMFIKEALKPARVEKVNIKGNTAYIDVASDQKALAIGKQAVNIRLASNITGYKIQVS
ncbi:transcription termination factor NusA [Candidatus Absconditicoccus praedator]|uniref:transcription termination factor NusA n=1 Tax=Candidatus Absconditicoccus praedator TaxID=2735562 RepID=UPI001E55035C|nr:transcription termination factor NusA [Candidatus Absconditicoccus praedator]UFX82671.1 transcription termination factor NusA [Candidatus Absconditicoccus praedator]